MSQTQQIRRAWLAAFGLFASLACSLASSAAELEGQRCAEEPLIQLAAAEDALSSTGETAPSGDVQERAGPRMGPGGMARGVKPGAVEGAILEKGRVLVQPGYVLQPQADGSVMARKPGGGSGGSSFSCFCALGRGGCKMVVQGGSAWCSKTADNPCSNTCDMKISKFSDGGMIMQ
ncbi:MAG: hypothetical protein U0231_01140 [Nitrospiraceae bacterium]